MHGIKQNRLFNIAAIFIVAMLVFTRCNKTKQTGDTDAITELRPVMYSYDSQTLISDSGNVKVKVTSKEMQVFENDTVSFWLFPRGMYVERFDALKQTESEITSKYAKYFRKDEFFELRDSVVAKKGMEEIFETDLLYWDRKKKTVYTDQYIKITQVGKGVTEGYGFEAADDFSRWEIKNSKAIFEVEIDE